MAHSAVSKAIEKQSRHRYLQEAELPFQASETAGSAQIHQHAFHCALAGFKDGGWPSLGLSSTADHSSISAGPIDFYNAISNSYYDVHANHCELCIVSLEMRHESLLMR
eukprot:1144640-Pelagomonas_calceolata.AAC.4